MAQNEAARKTSEPIVVSDTPDVCLTPQGSAMVPVPYEIVAYFSKSMETTTTVVFTEDPVFTTGSAIEGVLGDEAGTGMGLVSGSHASVGYCHVVAQQHTLVVKAQGQLIVFHSSKMEMNCSSPQGTGNTIGTVIWQQTSSTASADADGNVEGDTNPEEKPENEKELEKKLDEENSWNHEKEELKLKDSEAGGSYQDVAKHKEYGGAEAPNSLSPKTEVNVGYEKTSGNSWKQYGGENANVKVGGYETTHGAGYSFDPSTGTHSVGGGGSVAVYGAKGHAQAALPTDIAGVSGDFEALSAKAGGQVKAFAGPEGAGVGGEIGAEASLIKGKVGGVLNITPKTIWDSTAGAVLGRFDSTKKYAEAPEYLDVGVTVGAEVEAGIGAAIGAEGEAKIDEKGAKASGKVKLGLGPSASAKVTGGVRLPKSWMKAISSYFGVPQ